MTKSAYIHIPFCRRKCNYCSFVSFPELGLKEQYLDALKKQIENEYKGEKLNTLYFGGGTPSLLSVEEFKSLIDLFELEEDAEITVEVNPESVDLECLSGFKKLGVNRLSIGSQTFDDEILKLIGRGHSSAQTSFALNCAREAGFKNVSLDLIYGLPTQTLKGFETDLKTVIDFDVEHVSLYGLKIDEGCYFHEHPPIHLPPNLDEQADMYLTAVKMLTNAGFEHYEISNFGGKCFKSKHNLNYWNNEYYYGFGCAASGYTDKIRYTNQNDLKKYIQNPLAKISEQKLTSREILEEAIFLGLRKIAGVNVVELNKKFGIDFNKKYSKILEKYSDYFIKTEQGYALTLDGILISNEILAEFIEG